MLISEKKYIKVFNFKILIKTKFMGLFAKHIMPLKPCYLVFFLYLQ